jgi:hypothetical protein
MMRRALSLSVQSAVDLGSGSTRESRQSLNQYIALKIHSAGERSHFVRV